jgi:anti-sigma B factor antagonist
MPIENMQAIASDGPQAGQRVLRLKGPLSLHTVFEFQNVVRAETSPYVIIDFTGVPFVDSAGLGALVGAHISAQKARRKISFAGMNTQVMALLEMTRIRGMFSIYDTVEEAQGEPI